MNHVLKDSLGLTESGPLCPTPRASAGPVRPEEFGKQHGFEYDPSLTSKSKKGIMCICIYIYIYVCVCLSTRETLPAWCRVFNITPNNSKVPYGFSANQKETNHLKGPPHFEVHPHAQLSLCLTVNAVAIA